MKNLGKLVLFGTAISIAIVMAVGSQNQARGGGAAINSRGTAENRDAVT